MSTTATAVPIEAPADDRQLAILIVDDHEVVHWGFRLKLSRENWVRRCLGARNSEEAILLTRRYEPQVALVDLMLGDESGADVCERIRAASPSTRVLLMSGTGRIASGAARSVGASGFVPKGWPTADILKAVHTVGLGGTLFAPAAEPSPSTLSTREQQVLDDLASGATNREIAAHMHLSPHTVKEHVSSLYRKLGARNRAGAVQRAQRLGLLA
ncbi:MAG: two component transcriptional regulator, LuxR family [Solirubrobacterales bacterium]|nr:two component transcriptional regulator, LuxR family [Solirubrobacterales bacterium]